LPDITIDGASLGWIIDRITVEQAMSETSHSVGRIAVLTAFTLLFAAAWRGDAPDSSRPATVVAWTKRGSGPAVNRDSVSGIAEGLASARPMAPLPSQITGQYLTSGARRIVPHTRPSALLFFSGPSKIGRTATPATKDPVSTANAGSEQVR
jgi:hypothetical protein